MYYEVLTWKFFDLDCCLPLDYVTLCNWKSQTSEVGACLLWVRPETPIISYQWVIWTPDDYQSPCFKWKYIVFLHFCFILKTVSVYTATEETQNNVHVHVGPLVDAAVCFCDKVFLPLWWLSTLKLSNPWRIWTESLDTLEATLLTLSIYLHVCRRTADCGRGAHAK